MILGLLEPDGVIHDQLAAQGHRQTLLWFHEHGLDRPCVTPRGEVHWKRPIYGTVYQLLTIPIVFAFG